MLEIYISSGKNKRAARREFIHRYPDRLPPAENSFVRIYTKFLQQCSLDNLKRTRTKEVLNVETELNVLLYLTEDPHRSTRDAARYFNVSQHSIMNVLKAHKLTPFHLLPVQKLLPGDPNLRLLFCQEVLNRHHENNNFIRNVFWTDESSFSTVNLFNRKNCHYWATENPHKVRSIKIQGRRSVNVWCGIHRNKIIGPVFIDGRLTGASYLNLLENDIEEHIDEIPLMRRHTMVWQHDGAPPHNVRAVTNFLNEKYPLWIGRFGQINWPARSPDLNPLDFFLWGTLKTKIYEDGEIADIDDLKNRITNAVNLLNRNDEWFERMVLNFIKRCELCIQNNGGHVEHLF